VNLNLITDPQGHNSQFQLLVSGEPGYASQLERRNFSY
jgi:hypothetical protein